VRPCTHTLMLVAFEHDPERRHVHTHTCWLRSSPRLGHTRHTSRTRATKFGHGPAQALASGPFAAVRLHRASRTPTPAVVRWWQRSRQRGRTPAASRRLPGPHSSGGRFPPQRPPALKTSRPSSPRSPSSLPGAVSRSSSPSIGRPSRPCVSATPARVSRSSACILLRIGMQRHHMTCVYPSPHMTCMYPPPHRYATSL
jgi:hypothetical protein